MVRMYCVHACCRNTYDQFKKGFRIFDGQESLSMYRNTNGTAMFDDKRLGEWTKECFPTPSQDVENCPTKFTREGFRYSHAWADLMSRLSQAWLTYRAGHTDASSIDAKVYGQNAPAGQTRPPKNFKYTELSTEEIDMSGLYLCKLAESVSKNPCSNNHTLFSQCFEDAAYQKIATDRFQTAKDQQGLFDCITRFNKALTSPSVDDYLFMCSEIGLNTDSAVSKHGPVEVPMLTLNGLKGADILAASAVLKEASDLILAHKDTASTFLPSETSLPKGWRDYELDTLSPLYFFRVPFHLSGNAQRILFTLPKKRSAPETAETIESTRPAKKERVQAEDRTKMPAATRKKAQRPPTAPAPMDMQPQTSHSPASTADAHVPAQKVIHEKDKVTLIVEAIIGDEVVREFNRDVKKYIVKWQGFTEAESTSEYRTKLIKSKAIARMIREYDDQKKMTK